MHKTWSRAEQTRACKESHQIFPSDGPPPRRLQFFSSFENDKPAMGLLLGWEYGRMWLKEHKEFVARELTNAKPIFIDPDFTWWVNKRTVVMDRRQFYLKKKQDPHKKNCDLSAFAVPKSQRQKTAESEAAPDSQKQEKTDNSGSNIDSKSTLKESETKGKNKSKAKKCNCKECIQRSQGGQEIKSGSYGPDNRKLLFITRKVVSMPWY